MKRYIYILLMILVHAHFLKAQHEDKFNKLSFHSELEATSFQSSFNYSNQQFALMLSVNAEITEEQVKYYEKELNKLYKVLDKKNIHKKDTKQAVKILFKTAHKRLLKNYKELAELHEVFESGDYNCLTATIIFALILDEFNIPYEVHELPTHVYIVVDPNGEKLVLESTDPKNGIYKVDKEAWAEDLERLQIISQQEFRSKSADELFEKYGTVPPAVISYNEMAADLYFNSSIVHYENGNYDEAYAMIDKGMYLYPKRAANYNRIAIIYQLTFGMDIKRPQSLEPLFILLNEPNYRAAAAADIVHNLRFAGQKFLMENNDPVSYYRVKNFIDDKLKDIEFDGLKSELKHSHHFCLGYSLALKDKNTEALQELEQALDIKPYDVRSQSVITEVVTDQLRSLPLEEIYDSLSLIGKKYSFLANFEVYQQFLVIGMAGKVAHYFDNKNRTLGFRALEEFNQIIATKPLENPVYQEAVSIAYTAVQKYFIVQSDFDKALVWVKKGLSFIPNDEQLLRKKELLEEYR